MSDTNRPNPPGKDVRALFDKAKVGDSRYRTFAPRKERAKSELESAPQVAASPAAAPLPRRTLGALFEAHSGLHIESSRTEHSGAARAAIVFASIAGGVGKTTLCATTARVLSSRRPNVLLADRCTGGILPYYFGADRQRQGGLQVIHPSTRRPGYAMTIVNAPSGESLVPATAEWLAQLEKESALTLMDFPSFESGSTVAKALRASHVVIPITPDIQSIATLGACDELFAQSPDGQKRRCIFVLNRFDETRSLHREIRNHLEKTLEDRLAPMVLRESEAVAEALSQGMTVVDHAPNSSIARDFTQLVDWLQEQIAEASAEEIGIA